MKLCKTLAQAAMFAVGLGTMAAAQSVEIVLVDRLDGDLSEYCFDIRGSGARADPSRGLQAHTCYSYRGDLGVDQLFESTAIASNSFHMPVFDVCATFNTTTLGANLDLSACDGRPAQQVALRENGTIGPSSRPDLCMTVGTDTRLGRGGTSRHQIKDLTLQTCTAEAAARQTWRTRTEAD